MLVITRAIREFIGRDWAALRANKDAYWAERIRRRGAVEGLRAADELRRQMRLHDPGWPGVALRRADLLEYATLSELLERASPSRRA